MTTTLVVETPTVALARLVEPLVRPVRKGWLPWGTHLSFSKLKLISGGEGCPAVFRAALDVPFVPTASMRLGTLVHHYLFGGAGPSGKEIRVCPVAGTRCSRAWKAWAWAQPLGAELLTQGEAAEAQTIADAVSAAPHNRPHWRRYIEGREYETALEWQMHGFLFRTGGIDVLDRAAGEIVDVKTCRSSSPRKFGWQLRDLSYPEQLACFDEACRQNGIALRSYKLFAICTSRPYVVTPFNLPLVELAAARARLAEKCELLHRCLDRDDWPGYVPAGEEAEIEGPEPPPVTGLRCVDEEDLDEEDLDGEDE